MKINIPSQLFKYRALNENTLNIFRENKIFAPKPNQLNDPFDCHIEFDINITEDEFIFSVDDLMRSKDFPGYGNIDLPRTIDMFIGTDGKFRAGARERLHKNLDSAFSIAENYGVLCFSEINNDVLMWSHYGDDHKGICIEFSSENGAILGNGNYNYPVTYHKEYPRVTVPELISNPHDIYKKLIWMKSDIWEYEKEWRLVDKLGGRKVELPGPISGVIFGMRCPKETKEIIKRTIGDDSKIVFKKATPTKSKFGIEIVQDEE